MTMSLLLTALWFPLWFFVQSALSPEPGESAVVVLRGTAWLMPLLFVVLPILVLRYWKIGIVDALALRKPTAVHLLAGLLVGVSAWIPAHELNVLQQSIVGIPEAFLRMAQQIKEAIELLPWPMVILFLAVVPAICEELLFRGFLMSGLSTSAKKWTAILASAGFFAVFHFILFKFVVAGALGVVLGYLCWQSRSIFPGVLAHAMHNTLGVLSVIQPKWTSYLGVPEAVKDTETSLHLPSHLLVLGCGVFVFAILLASRRATPARDIRAVGTPELLASGI
jgi:membrane protease YdiL (CAAX protease family)